MTGERTMDCGRGEELLADWMEGESGPEFTALEAHLATCSSCSALAEDLRRIATTAASLPDITPPRDLWPEIAVRLTPRQAGYVAGAVLTRHSASHPVSSTRRFRIERWRAPLAAAAAVLVVATGALLVTRSGDNAPVPTAAAPSEAPAASGEAILASSQPVNSAQLLSQSYAAEIEALTTILANDRGILDTATVGVLRRNLEVIDAAIQESRQALEQDPASELLTEQLNVIYDMKLEMLRRTVILSSGA